MIFRNKLVKAILNNVLKTECERLVEEKLIKDGLIQFYMRYVDDP